MREREAMSADCPDCGSSIRFKKAPQEGEMVSCPVCDALLEVVDTEPIILDWADGYDDDDYDDDDDDDDDDYYDDDDDDDGYASGRAGRYA